MDLIKTEEKAAGKDDDKKSASSLTELFQTLSRTEDDKNNSDGKSVSVSRIQDWLKQAKIPEKDATAALSDIDKSKDKVDMAGFQQILEKLASKMKTDTNNLLRTLKSVEMPNVKNIMPGGSSSTPDEGKSGGGGGGIIDSIKRFAGFSSSNKKEKQ